MFETLTVARHTVTFEAVEAIGLPEYAGAMFRGALGLAFRKVSCALPRCDCKTCLLRFRCAYSVCFETPIPNDAEILRRYPFAPHPFVIEPPEDGRNVYEPGECFTLGLCLIGRGRDYLPYFIYALDELARQGLGRGRGKARLLRVTSVGDSRRVLYDSTTQELAGDAPSIKASDIASRVDALRDKPLRMDFRSPMRIKKDNQFSKDPGLARIMPSLLRRLHSLDYFHCGGLPSHEVHPLLEAARRVRTIEGDTRWFDWHRFSTRQNTAMRLGGFVGHAVYEPVPESLLHLLAWGELVHVGKASSFGHGRYLLSTAE